MSSKGRLTQSLLPASPPVTEKACSANDTGGFRMSSSSSTRMKSLSMQWVAIFLIQSGTIVPICAHFPCCPSFTCSDAHNSDVSRTSNISVSSYLRTAAAVQGQDDMGNDLLMARVELTPTLEGHVIIYFSHCLTTFSDTFSYSTPRTNGTAPQLGLGRSISK